MSIGLKKVCDVNIFCRVYILFLMICFLLLAITISKMVL